MRTPVQIIRDYRKGKKGFTLVEVIIASSLFSVVSLIGIGIFVNVMRIQKRIYLENAIYEDGRFMMERLSREIRQNAIDYEEYYNKLVEGVPYGAEYGCYATRFYNPGTNGPGLNFSELGALCNDGTTDPKDKPGCIIDKRTLDVNTGLNPYQGTLKTNETPDAANAMCDSNYTTATDCSTNFAYNDRTELYLIDPKGKQKTIFARKMTVEIDPADPTKNEYALSLLRIIGEDANKDDVVEKWYDSITPNYYCAPLFDCTPDALLPAFTGLESTLDGSDPAMLYKGFVPVSPMRTNIASLHFYVAPLEDPRKAFAETTTALAIQQQPHVTIVMTLKPATSELSTYKGIVPTITLQTTVTSRVYNEVKSYPADGVCDSTGYL